MEKNKIYIILLLITFFCFCNLTKAQNELKLNTEFFIGSNFLNNKIGLFSSFDLSKIQIKERNLGGSFGHSTVFYSNKNWLFGLGYYQVRNVDVNDAGLNLLINGNYNNRTRLQQITNSSFDNYSYYGITFGKKLYNKDYNFNATVLCSALGLNQLQALQVNKVSFVSDSLATFINATLDYNYSFTNPAKSLNGIGASLGVLIEKKFFSDDWFQKITLEVTNFGVIQSFSVNRWSQKNNFRFEGIDFSSIIQNQSISAIASNKSITDSIKNLLYAESQSSKQIFLPINFYTKIDFKKINSFFYLGTTLQYIALKGNRPLLTAFGMFETKYIDIAPQLGIGAYSKGLCGIMIQKKLKNWNYAIHYQQTVSSKSNVTQILKVNIAYTWD